ncbi:MAG: YceD family protein, partial [Prevotella sp.]
MCSLEQFKIDLKALTEDVTPLEWELGNHFFQQLEGAQLQKGSVHVSGTIRKSVGFYELQLHCEGTVEVPCDRCLDIMSQPIEADLHLIVKLGAEYAEDDEVITV